MINSVSTSGLDWFRSAKFGLFIHWGLYSVPAGEWRGKKVSSIGEYLMHAEYIPISEYETIAAQFDPAGFNAREWVGRAEEAGMRYLVFTAKHHDGFAMYRSKVDRFNVVEATPFGRDVVAELAEACRESPVKLGVYYSHCVDWHEPHGGNLPGDLRDDGIVWGNDWDFPKGTPEGFDLYLRNKVEPQLTELLTNYGPLALIWFDTPTKSLRLDQATRIKALVKRLQPDCLVSAALGHGLGDFDVLGDNALPQSLCERATEVETTLNDTWGYKTHDHNWKSVGRIRSMLQDVNSKNCNLLLNIGPKSDGTFPAPAIDCLLSLANF